jgi:AbrB family looped-hinge helix DNA binding protein
MMVSIDRAGRVVIPKAIREQLGMGPRTRLSLEVVGGGVRLTPQRPPGRRVVEVDGWPVIEAAPDHVVTDADVQGWRDADQG